MILNINDTINDTEYNSPIGQLYFSHKLLNLVFCLKSTNNIFF